MTPAAPQTASLTSRASWLMFAKTVGFIFSVALPLLLVRRLNQEQFGLYKQVFLVVGTAINLLPLGFSMSAFYYLPREPDKRPQTIFNIMAFNTLVGALACLLLFFYPSILTAIFHEPQLGEYAPLIGVVILTWIVGAFLEGVPIANEEIKLATKFIIGTHLARASLLVMAALLFGTVRSLICAAILYGVIQTAVLVFYLRSRFKGFWHSFDWPMVRRQFSYAIPLGSASLLLMMQTDLHNYFVSNRFGPAMFAIYAVGTIQLPLLILLQDATNSVLITRVGVMQKQEQNLEIIALTARAARKLAAIYFPVYVLLMVVGPEFIKFVFTPRYLESWPIFAINLTLLPVGIFLPDPLVRSYASERYFVLSLRVAIIAALVLVLALWTRQLGLIGVVAFVVGINIVERIAIAIHFGRLVGVKRRDIFLLKDVGKLAIACLVAGFACAVLRYFIAEAAPLLVLAACGLVFATVYASSAYFLRIPTKDEYGRFRETLWRYLPPSLKFRWD